MIVTNGINVMWALDFMQDALTGGRIFRMLNVIDEADRRALEIDVAVGLTRDAIPRPAD
ncbi:MAG: hypothetical protein IPP91_14905 [Betaproteobacteria bacterium]|nr:hypothetical protein [Betaproteobacteria bacterium]